MRKVYDNGRIIEHENKWYMEFPYAILGLNREYEDFKDIYFKTEEEAHSYAQEHGLKEDEYSTSKWMV